MEKNNNKSNYYIPKYFGLSGPYQSLTLKANFAYEMLKSFRLVAYTLLY